MEPLECAGGGWMLGRAPGIPMGTFWPPDLSGRGQIPGFGCSVRAQSMSPGPIPGLSSLLGDIPRIHEVGKAFPSSP